MSAYVKVYSDELAHHGVKGMKWGVRRYQNSDGTLTPAGKKRKAKQDYKDAKKAAKARQQQGFREISSAADSKNSKYRDGSISRIEYENFKAKNVKKTSNVEAKYRTEVAEAKKEYRLAKGKDPYKVEAKLQKELKRIERHKNSNWDNYVEDLVETDPRMANSLSKLGTIKTSEINKAHESIQRRMEAEAFVRDYENARVKSENARLQRELDELKRQNNQSN